MGQDDKPGGTPETKEKATAAPEPTKIESPETETGLETANRIEREIQLGAITDPAGTKLPSGETVEEARRALREKDEKERRVTEDAVWNRVREQYGMNETTATQKTGVAVLADKGSASLRLVEEHAPPGEPESQSDQQQGSGGGGTQTSTTTTGTPTTTAGSTPNVMPVGAAQKAQMDALASTATPKTTADQNN
jgi:hypothetical protein